MADHVQRDLDMLQRTLEHLGQFFVLPELHQFQMVRDNLPGDAAFAAAAFELQQQALPQVLCADAGGVQRMHYADAFLDIGCGEAAFHGQFFRRGHQIAVFVQVADDGLRGVADGLRSMQPERAGNAGDRKE